MPPPKKPIIPPTPASSGEPAPPPGGEATPPLGGQTTPPLGGQTTSPASTSTTGPPGYSTTEEPGYTTYDSTTEPPGHSGYGTALDAVFGGGCGDRNVLRFRSFERIEGIQSENLRTAGDAYYEGMFERIGAFRAVDELVTRFLGGLNLDTVVLSNKLCSYMRQEPLRLTPEDRHRVLSLFGDEALERILLRLSDAVIAFDLSRAPGGIAISPSTLPEPATRLAVIDAIEQLELFLDAAVGGGANFVTNEVGRQLRDILSILDDPDLRNHVAGNDIDDVFAVIAGLLADESDRPTDWEARQQARKASFGRKIFLEIAAHVDAIEAAVAVPGADPDADDFEDGELAVIGGLAYQWRVANGCGYADMVDAAADEEAADEKRAQVIRLRRRAW